MFFCRIWATMLTGAQQEKSMAIRGQLLRVLTTSTPLTTWQAMQSFLLRSSSEAPGFHHFLLWFNNGMMIHFHFMIHLMIYSYCISKLCIDIIPAKRKMTTRVAIND